MATSWTIVSTGNETGNTRRVAGVAQSRADAREALFAAARDTVADTASSHELHTHVLHIADEQFPVAIVATGRAADGSPDTSATLADLAQIEEVGLQQDSPAVQVR